MGGTRGSLGSSAKANRMRVPGNRRGQRKGKGKGMSLDALGKQLGASQADAQDSRNRQRRRGVAGGSAAARGRATKLGNAVKGKGTTPEAKANAAQGRPLNAEGVKQRALSKVTNRKKK